MFVVSRELGRLVRLRHGVVTWSELKADGLGSGTLRRYLDTGALVRLHPGIYRFGTAPDTLESRCVAACLADDRVVVSHLTAARLHHCRRVGDDDVVHLIVRGDRVPLSSGVVTHRTKALAPGDVEQRIDHIRLTTALRTTFDLASVLGDLDLESVIEQLLDRRRITVPELHAIGRRLRAPGRTGSARFCRVVCGRDGWLRPADSHLEVRMWRALGGSGITGLVRQHRCRAGRRTGGAPRHRRSRLWMGARDRSRHVARRSSGCTVGQDPGSRAAADQLAHRAGDRRRGRTLARRPRPGAPRFAFRPPGHRAAAEPPAAPRPSPEKSGPHMCPNPAEFRHKGE